MILLDRFRKDSTTCTLDKDNEKLPEREEFRPMSKREIPDERARAGLAHARQNGRRLGRPATAAIHTEEVRKLGSTGLTKSEIARQLNIGSTSVRRIPAALPKKK